MKGNIFNLDWLKKADILGSDEDRKMFVGAVNRFAADPSRVDFAFQEAVKTGRIQELTSTSDWPAKVKEVIDRILQVGPAIDEQYRALFNPWRDFTGTKRDGFKIRNCTAAITFREYQAGRTITVDNVAGTDAEIAFALYSAATENLKVWLDDEEWWTLEDSVTTFVKKWYFKKAAVIYALLAAVGSGQNTSFGGVSTDATYVRDIKTIDSAITSIIADLVALNYAIEGGEQFVIVAPIQLRMRLTAALSAVFGASPNTAYVSLQNYSIKPIFTTHFTSTTTYYVVLPGYNIQGGDRQLLETDTAQDIKVAGKSIILVGNARCGAAIGEVKQVRRCAIA